jgi:hypothetical protein
MVPSTSRLHWGLCIPISVWLCVWVVLLILQVHTLAQVEASAACLLPTLSIFATPFAAAVWSWRRSKWGRMYRMGSNIPYYEELYGGITDNHRK